MMQFIDPTFQRPDIIARCEKTGAELGKTRAQYWLAIPGQRVRCWSRRKITSDEAALQKANTFI